MSQNAQDSLNERLHFIGMDQQARSALRKLKPFLAKALSPALKAFYDKVKATPQTRKFFGDERHMETAAGAQERHWAIIADADFDQTYASAVRRIGQTHARIGLEPRWYIGGYALVIDQLIHAVVKDKWPRLTQLAKARPEDMAASLSCLVKAAMLDMDLAISVYLETLAEQRRVAEDANETAKQQANAAVEVIGIGLGKLAAQNLSFRLSEKLPDAYAKLQSDFNTAIEQLEQAMSAVSNCSDAIHSGTREISSAADDLSHRTEQQAASLEQTAAAIDQITATVQKSAEAASHARNVVSEADEDARKSANVVKDAVSAMDAIAKSSQQINQIIGVIDEIAFQTNLLALNAGVEAARAGEAGRGFAVVASEVRALAQRSAEAAKEIKCLISASSTQVDHGVALVSETGKSLERIMHKVSDINSIVAQIADGAKEQAAGLSQVNTAINEMDKVTQQNAAMVQETTAASHSLSQETEQLSELVGKFHMSMTDAADTAMRHELMRAAPHAFARTASPEAPSRHQKTSARR